MRKALLTLALVVAGSAAIASYVGASWTQKERLNLSPAAGGQYPYLAYAKDVARKG